MEIKELNVVYACNRIREVLDNEYKVYAELIKEDSMNTITVKSIVERINYVKGNVKNKISDRSKKYELFVQLSGDITEVVEKMEDIIEKINAEEDLRIERNAVPVLVENNNVMYTLDIRIYIK